jgi:hypothetical protein
MKKSVVRPSRQTSAPAMLGLDAAANPIPAVPQVQKRRSSAKIFDDPAVVKGYESVPLLETDKLPRGGISLETKAVGRVQVSLFEVFGIDT